MSALFEVRDVDRKFYEERVRDFLPDRIVDIHVHVYRCADRGDSPPRSKRMVSWPSLVAKENPIEDLIETYRLMFPGKRVTPMMFSTIPRRDNLQCIDAMNGYVSECSRKHDFPALIFSLPQWTGEELEKRLDQGGFLGIKSYLSFAPANLSSDDITIFDFFPPHQFEVLNRRGLIMMLHLPRSGRLKDPTNLEHLLQIEKKYPDIKLVIAHVGRAYCRGDVGDAFEVLSKTDKMLFDFSANTNDWVFEQMITAVGPKRILFGSDLPVLRMRMRRIERDGIYVNLVPKGLYGDVTDDPNMDEIEGGEADKLTFFMYEEIDAFRRAAEKTHLCQTDIEDIFYNNAMRIIEGSKA